jgi:hypothetical protein
MRSEPNLRIEEYRYCPPGYESPPGVNWGAFQVCFRGCCLRVISSGTDDEHGWEHVSVSLLTRCPTWEEMQHVKELFFQDEECVIQFHPPKSMYVNFHQYCLHLWRPLHQEITLPPMELIAPAT